MFLSAWQHDTVDITSLQMHSTLFKPSGIYELCNDKSSDNVLGYKES